MSLESALREGYIVAADSWLDVVVVWDGTTKFEMYKQRDLDTWVCIDYFSTTVANAFEAKVRAKKWIANTYETLEKFFGEAA
jgi:hypothetical protein